VIPSDWIDGEGQRIPFNCFKTASTLIPERNAREINREIDSDWDAAQPPDLPIVENTSNGWPSSSNLWLRITAASGDHFTGDTAGLYRRGRGIFASWTSVLAAVPCPGPGFYGCHRGR